ncbi:hypothetical protein BKA81DRAFT_357006 [Phyllosticta paracitricarpa]
MDGWMDGWMDGRVEDSERSGRSRGEGAGDWTRGDEWQRVGGEGGCLDLCVARSRRKGNECGLLWGSAAAKGVDASRVTREEEGWCVEGFVAAARRWWSGVEWSGVEWDRWVGVWREEERW